MKISILNYNIGNITSIHNMLNRIGLTAEITNDPDFIDQSSHIILPGIGSFDHCMRELRKAPFYSHLSKWVFEDRKKILGVCVGHQMLFEHSEEGTEEGLAWIKGHSKRFDFKSIDPSIRVPHMGWNKIIPSDNPLFIGLEDSKFYFTHSFYTVPDHENQTIAFTDYGIRFTSSVNVDNIYGVQFHPEKSHKFGMKLYENFSKL